MNVVHLVVPVFTRTCLCATFDIWDSICVQVVT